MEVWILIEHYTGDHRPHVLRATVDNWLGVLAEHLTSLSNPEDDRWPSVDNIHRVVVVAPNADLTTAAASAVANATDRYAEDRKKMRRRELRQKRAALLDELRELGDDDAG